MCHEKYSIFSLIYIQQSTQSFSFSRFFLFFFLETLETESRAIIYTTTTTMKTTMRVHNTYNNLFHMKSHI